MVLLLQSSQEYNNDLRSMIMAFYPGIKIVERRDKAENILFVFHAEYKADATLLWIEKSEYTEHERAYGRSLDCSDANLTEAIKVEGDYLDKENFRNNLKRASYELLSGISGRKLPWGDLTGVRPTKIAMKQLSAGKTYEETIRNYIDVYGVSGQKARLATDVAVNEMALTQGIDTEQGYCLYVGIPFCPSRCLYCSFASYPIDVYKDKSVKYIDRLCQELAAIAEAYKDRKLISVYIGGGTPTAINHMLLDRLLTQIDTVFELNGKNRGILEYTVEAGRPDSITAEKLEVMKKHGVTRISINPQTMNDETLRTIGRAHSSKQTEEAFALARSLGFDNINMDLIAGLPGENLESMRYTLSKIKALSPESITVHSLAIKRAANLKQQMESYVNSINQDMDEMHNMAAELSKELGMEPYYLYRQKNIGGNLENVGYAKKGTECLYNILIMEEMTDIIAAGAGASTKLIRNLAGDSGVIGGNGGNYRRRIDRIENCKSVDDYIERFDEMLARKNL